MLYFLSFGISPSLHKQIQYALTHVLIEPQEFCQALHLCSKTTSSAAAAAAQSHAPLLRAVESMVRRARATAGQRPTVEQHHKRRVAAAHNPLAVDQFGYKAELAAGTMVGSKYSTVLRRHGGAPSVAAQSDTVLKVLQISDIHPDLDYSEVSSS